MGPNILKRLIPKKSLPTINGFLLTAITGIVGTFLILYTTADAKLAPITLALYFIVFALILINWQSVSNVRKGLALCSSLMAFALTVGLFSFEYLDKFLFMTIMLLLTIVTISAVKISPKFMNAISVIALGLSAHFFVQSFGYYDTYFATLLPSGDSSLNLNNPNGMGLIMLVCFLLFDRSKLIRNALIRLTFLIMTVIGMFNYGSRSVLLCLLLYYGILYVIRKKPIVFSRNLIFSVVILFGLLFPVFYVSSYNSSDSRGSTAEVLGKKIYSGRQEQWSDVIRVQNENIFTGSLNTELLETFPSKSTHNMYLDISFQTGLPFLFSFLFILYLCVIRNKNLTRKTFASVIIILVYGFFETVFEAGNANSMLMVLVFINADLSADSIEESH